MSDRKPTTRRGEARIRIETRADEPTATGRFSLDIHLSKESARKLLVAALEFAAIEIRDLDMRRDEVGKVGSKESR